MLKKSLRPIYRSFVVQKIIGLSLLIFFAPLVAVFIVVSRYRAKPIDIGLGPEPLINNVHHKAALKHYGFTAETFVNQVYFITDEFDIRGDRFKLPLALCANYLLGLMVLWRYKGIYLYFNGGPFAWTWLRILEPTIYKLARVRTHVMPYGGDIHDMSRASNLNFKHALDKDYPHFHRLTSRTKAQVARWTKHATHVSSGCDWVQYMHHWDTLMIAHFSIDLNKWKTLREIDFPKKFRKARPLRLFHAPNHTTIKGTNFFVQAVEDLKKEGCAIELVMKRKVPNTEIRETIETCDVILDQLVIGWYAMFAIEAMALGKPVICYLDPQLIDFYEFSGLLKSEEIPILSATPKTIKQLIYDIYTGKQPLRPTAMKGRPYLVKYHSTSVIGAKFAEINKKMGIVPSGPIPS